VHADVTTLQNTKVEQVQDNSSNTAHDLLDSTTMGLTRKNTTIFSALAGLP